MSLRSPTENENGPRAAPDPILGRVRHSRMPLAGIQAEFGLDPRLKHSGVTVWGVASLSAQPLFSKEITPKIGVDAILGYFR